MPLIRFTILAIFGLVASQNQDVNSQTPYRKTIRQRSVEAATPIPPDPRVDDEGMELLLTRLQTLCEEKLEYLITDTNKRFQSLEHQSSKVHSTVDINSEKLDNLTTEAGRMSQCCQINENLEAKVENLSKDIQSLMDAIKILSSNVEVVKQNDSALINDARSLVDSLSNKASEPIFNDELQEPTNLQTANSTASPINLTPDTMYPKNCREVRESGKNSSGIYALQPDHAPKPFEAVCDLEMRGGNWTVIQRRYDGSQDFFLGSQEYKDGFGNLTGEFWLGLENIYLLTGHHENELLIELSSFDSWNASAFYSQFRIGSEREGYSLKSLGTYEGNAGDSLSFSVNAKFTTKDNGVSARVHVGAWWYHNSAYSSLNGKYMKRDQAVPIPGNHLGGLFWLNSKNNYRSYKTTRMLVRPKV